MTIDMTTVNFVYPLAPIKQFPGIYYYYSGTVKEDNWASGNFIICPKIVTVGRQGGGKEESLNILITNLCLVYFEGIGYGKIP